MIKIESLYFAEGPKYDQSSGQVFHLWSIF